MKFLLLNLAMRRESIICFSGSQKKDRWTNFKKKSRFKRKTSCAYTWNSGSLYSGGVGEGIQTLLFLRSLLRCRYKRQRCSIFCAGGLYGIGLTYVRSAE